MFTKKDFKKIGKGIIISSIIVLGTAGVYATNSSIQTYISHFSSSESEIGQLIRGFFDSEGYIKSVFIKDGSIDGSKLVNDSIGENQIDNNFKARNSDQLDGKDSTEFLGVNDTAKNSDKLQNKTIETTLTNTDSKIPTSKAVKTYVDNKPGDNLGNHIATQNIQLNGHYLSNDGGNEGIRVNNNGNVGIGTTTPRTKLDIKTSSYSEPAIMAGYNINNGITPGFSSVAMGNNTKASGDYSTAMGDYSKASGNYSTVMGYDTKASGDSSTAMGRYSEASGKASIAMGFSTKASGDSSTAMGDSTQASGNYSTAMGDNTQASGNYSTAMGYNSEASGKYSIAMGRDTEASGYSSTAMGFYTKASGSYSTAMGYHTKASGDYSIAMGDYSKASGKSSIAIGDNTQANGLSSIAMGVSTKANGSYSTAMGVNTIVNTQYSTILGKSGQTASDDVFAVAYGNYGDKDTAGAGLVFQVKRNGNVNVKGDICDGDGNNCKSVAELGRVWSKNGNDAYYNNGNVGIGTNNPRAKLEVENSGDGFRMGQIRIHNTNEINNLDGNLYLQYRGGKNTILNKGGGKVGIGTTLPSEKLEVNGNVKIDGKATSASTSSGDAGNTLATKDYVDSKNDAFSAYSSNIIQDKNGVVPFSEVNDYKGHYSSNKYTAPSEGYYYFTTSISFDGGDGGDDTQYLSFRYNGNQKLHLKLINPKFSTRSGREMTVSNSAVMFLHAGDTIEVYVDNADDPNINILHRSFSGFKLF